MSNKPRVFVGSSVEGLAVAYAIQTNLLHDCELTVWSQGAFELSKTTIESLMDLLNQVDFAIFVFTMDDILEIRGDKKFSVRDNVLFEFGLFLGKLGRERVFFVIPQGTNMHLPTDLLGITPATFDNNRTDRNLVAATGPACHAVRQALKKYGSLLEEEEESTVPELLSDKPSKSTDWVDDFIDKKYESCIAKTTKLRDESTEVRGIMEWEYWIRKSTYRMDEKKSHVLSDLIVEFPEELMAYKISAGLLSSEDFHEEAIAMLKAAQEKFGNSAIFIRVLSSYHLANGDREQAINTFQNDLVYDDPETATAYAQLYIDDKDPQTARSILHQAYTKFPKNLKICSLYAGVASDLSEYAVALVLCDRMATIQPDEYSHHGYLGNMALNLNLNDISLSSYQKADEMSEGKESWIISNIGNLLKNRGFYTESIKYFQKSLAVYDSDYAHERLAGAIKSKDEEFAKYQGFLKEGQRKLKEYGANLLLNSSNVNDGTKEPN